MGAVSTGNQAGTIPGVGTADRAVGVITCSATVAALALSYRNQINFATQHADYPVWLAWMFPLMIDSFVICGEIRLFSATARNEGWHVKAWAWLMTGAGLAVSVIFGVSHVDWSALGPAGVKFAAAVAPLAAAASLGTGLGLVKRRARRPGQGHRAAGPGEAATASAPRELPVAAPRRPARARADGQRIEAAREMVAAARSSGQPVPGREKLAGLAGISPHQARVVLLNGSAPTRSR